MANEFKIKNGFFSEGSSNITGSLTVSGGITGSLFGTASYASQALSSSYALTASYVAGGITVPGSDTQVIFNNGGALGANSGFVYSGSRVGIGIVNPTASIHTSISDNAFASSAIFENTNAGSSALASIAFKNASQGVASIYQLNSSGDLGLFNSATTGKISFFTNAIDRMTIDSAGLVGIGTASPFQLLDVTGGHITTYDSSAKEGKITFNNGAGAIRWDQLNGKLHLVANSADRLTIDSSGQVGIGTTSPTQTLDVNGNIGVGGYIIDTLGNLLRWNSDTYSFYAGGGDAENTITYQPDQGIASITDQTAIEANWPGGSYYNGQVLYKVVAGETILRGQLLYLASNGKWSKAGATTINGSTQLLGIALDGGSLDDPISVLLDGIIITDYHAQYNTAVPGLPLYISTTKGYMSETAPSGSGEVVRLIGHNIYDNGASGGVIIRFQPDNTWLEL